MCLLKLNHHDLTSKTHTVKSYKVTQAEDEIKRSKWTLRVSCTICAPYLAHAQSFFSSVAKIPIRNYGEKPLLRCTVGPLLLNNRCGYEQRGHTKKNHVLSALCLWIVFNMSVESSNCSKVLEIVFFFFLKFFLMSKIPKKIPELCS